MGPQADEELDVILGRDLQPGDRLALRPIALCGRQEGEVVVEVVAVVRGPERRGRRRSRRTEGPPLREGWLRIELDRWPAVVMRADGYLGAERLSEGE